LAFITRRRFLQSTALIAGAAPVALAVEGRLLEPSHPRLVRVELSLSRLPAAFDGFTIVQLSDFHYDDYFCYIPLQKAVAMVNQLKPDLVVLTGDFVTSSVLVDYVHDEKLSAAAVTPCANLLAQLQSRLGMIAALGNHDVSADPAHITEVLQFHKIPVLRNSSMAIEQQGARLWFAGADDVSEGKPDLDACLRGIPRGEAVVLLVHEPDFADQAASKPIDLQLSGHSHGGQVWLPWIGAPWLPDFARKYPRGLYHIGPLTLYTNIGLGTIRVPVRVNCPPEVTLFTLRCSGRQGVAGQARITTSHDGRGVEPMLLA